MTEPMQSIVLAVACALLISGIGQVVYGVFMLRAIAVTLNELRESTQRMVQKIEVLVDRTSRKWS